MVDDDTFHKQSTQPGQYPEEKNPSIPFPEAPSYIGPYKIESLLEKGGMSVLYLGTHPETKEPTTIKVLLPKFQSHPDVVKRFLKEAEIIAMADHPNIVKLYGHGEWEGGLYIAMEFILGISLRQYILQNPMSLKRALEIIIDIAYALCHLHTHGVIHRDLKPENILVTETGGIKVIDFGIAQLLSEKKDPNFPTKQRTIGTPIYMSPEQREDPETVSYPSDIYSLGIIAYELVLGKLSHGQIHLSLMPKGLQKILNKALQPKPEDRYHDSVDFITDVTAYLNSPTMLKEKKVGDQLSEISENLRQAQTILMPNRAPQWPGLDIGIAVYKGIEFTGGAGIYYDFLELGNDTYGIFIGASSAKGAEGIVYSSIMRGMVQTLCRKAQTPRELVSMLNQVLVQDTLDQVFTLSYLVLSPHTKQLRYISCGKGNLWHIPFGKDTPEKIEADNIVLGVQQNAEFTEIIKSWEPGSTLLLANIASDQSDNLEEQEKNERLIKQSILETSGEPPQKQADAILRKIRLAAGRQSQKSVFLISIKLQG